MSIAAFAETAALAGDPARANMLWALMDGRSLTATELARAAGVTPQTASGHLARLAQAGLISVFCQGRHHYHRLASAAVARMIETIHEVAEGNAAETRRAVITGPRDAAMRAARTCYDHLAGGLAVRLADAMAEKGWLELSLEGGAVTEAGLGFFRDFGVDLDAAAAHSRKGRVFCRPCLDWSERRPHLGGSLGAALASRCFDLNWLRRVDGSRALSVTRAGEQGFRQAFGI